jgi:hypothetical protein
MPPPKDQTRYEEYIKRQVESHMGQKGARVGVILTEEIKNKMSISKIGMYDGEKNPFYDHKHTEETKQKMRKPKTEEHRRKIGEAKMGKPSWNKGIPATEEAKSKSRDAQKGEKSHCWKGGIAYLPYCFKFDRKRRRAVRNFFGNKCMCCGKHVIENIVNKKGQLNLSVHHVDHNKEQGCNGIPFNLVPMCAECHGKEISQMEEYRAYINKTLDEGFKWGIWSREQYEQEVMYSE